MLKTSCVLSVSFRPHPDPAGIIPQSLFPLGQHPVGVIACFLLTSCVFRALLTRASVTYVLILLSLANRDENIIPLCLTLT